MIKAALRVQALTDLDQLHGLLAAGQISALVDPLIVDPGLGDAKNLLDCATVKNPFLDQPSAQRLRLQPIKDGASQVWDNMNAHREQPLMPGDPRSLCGWVISPHPIFSISRHIARRLRQKKPSGRQALLRYYDPRVLQRLQAILDEEQLAFLLGPIHHWIFIDHAGCFRVFSSHPRNMTQSALSLSNPQWMSIDRIGLLNKTLAIGAEIMDIRQVDDQDIINLDRLLQVAELEGVSDDDARMIFALQGMRLPPNFHRHSEMIRLFQRCREGERYQELVREWSRETWQRIAEESEENIL
ncbi:DUF4123 domain-containing protein [Salinicola corii]|uniref:DUF4123 domain-containing protein n=1 Tax=Salinicola corii TaxID=2606937 RepID=A0A640WJL2_9GAMM|nr:DUF4123 domain-containing protein [Salinicola corii]KAA0020833.1 DUF4123 domain-containing protein [Salinicola corii]